jgi:hypothetical protein
MTGSPGIPPGCVVLKCWTDCDIKGVVARKNIHAAERNNGFLPRKTSLQRQNQKSQIELRAGISFV